ncbi:hypothetical protein GGX14DRAFT_559637 [Mycena pura]|uniref:Uncharacterized protein n=1 Tax=Mycena pura TaxID=153505 RepID=A0AAD6VUN9_9AGAR|nr:hypothetical protein GGX14DRAFT_559637 [Mycena pura]
MLEALDAKPLQSLPLPSAPNVDDDYLYSAAKMADPSTVFTFSPCATAGAHGQHAHAQAHEMAEHAVHDSSGAAPLGNCTFRTSRLPQWADTAAWAAFCVDEAALTAGAAAGVCAARRAACALASGAAALVMMLYRELEHRESDTAHEMAEYAVHALAWALP